jgi:hypothetical protein
VYGYGYNGSTKVTGWMVTNYLIFPLRSGEHS